ncbi:MAG: Mg chelatase, subunit ChlI [Steroidobacteraceae bacterium]|jgi:magnesium chelatase family protein|nr:Mg chelatase, subunit ChlI [Steroidobacteraceae bacterium]
MGLARVASRAQLGLSAPRVEVEVHLGGGLPTFTIVGMPATAVRESKDRVRAALANSGFEWPAGRITVNLSPADLPKEGCRYDLPIALGILLASSQITVPEQHLADSEFYGELGLAGELKPIKGVLLAAAHAAREHRALVLPSGNVDEARIAARRILAADNLLGVCALARAGAVTDAEPGGPLSLPGPSSLDLADVRGQAVPKRALIVAAAGGHSLLLVGAPGTGKSMLAQRLPGILPELDASEALDVAAIASVSTRGFSAAEFGRRPFRAPHHTASAGAIIGGGPRAQPGEVSLAHRGVLFLDELPEFNRAVLESLREPLESGVVAVSRAAVQVEYPARFQFVAAMNPCPCGYLGESTGKCRCAPPEIARYRARISGPLLDRIDLRVAVPAVSSEELLDESAEPRLTSAQAAVKVRAARDVQLRRAGKLNADLAGRELSEHCALDRGARVLLGQLRVKFELSARGVHRVLRVARTIADLELADLELADLEQESPSALSSPHLAEALQLRRAIS